MQLVLLAFLRRYSYLACMSYDLLFWRQRSEDTRLAKEIAHALSGGEQIFGLDHLPIERIMSRVNDRFPLRVDGGLAYWDGGAAGMFELYHSVQYIHFCCRQLAADHCNALVDIMSDFGCPLYDPQVNQRFDGASTDT